MKKTGLILTFMTTMLYPNILLQLPNNPFSYDLGMQIIAGETNKSSITLCCHGYGDSSRIVEVVHSFKAISGTLVGFNFPDYGITNASDHGQSNFGSIHEIMPLIYLMNYYACILHLDSINLYGFSAGGGAIINALATLNQNHYNEELACIGITPENRNAILNAVQKGHVILDCPLKSIAEIIAFRGISSALKIMASHYEHNNMTPINNLSLLSGLKLNIILHFQQPDDILSNRDDTIFIERLCRAHQGETKVILGFDGGHNAYHASLWEYYKKVDLNSRIS